MSDTSENTGADGIREGSSGTAPGLREDEVRDEVRLDLDESSLDAWEDVRGDYALDPESDVARPALTESEEDDDDLSPRGEDDEEDDLAEDDSEDDSEDDEDAAGDRADEEE